MFVNQKSTEICYALIRVSAQVRRVFLKNGLEKNAFKFMEEAVSEQFELALKTSAALEALLKIGQALYEIEPVNAKVISGELESVNSAMRQSIGIDGLPNLEKFFNNPAIDQINRQELGNPAKTFADIRHSSQVNDQNSGSEIIINSNGNGFSGTMRQSAIIEKIRQFSNSQAQLKDLLAAFPEISERTMRYDLQKLCVNGLLERLGSGGPGSYYLAKNRA